jgi:hypothetical protein
MSEVRPPEATPIATNDEHERQDEPEDEPEDEHYSGPDPEENEKGDGSDEDQGT